MSHQSKEIFNENKNVEEYVRWTKSLQRDIVPFVVLMDSKDLEKGVIK